MSGRSRRRHTNIIPTGRPYTSQTETNSAKYGDGKVRISEGWIIQEEENSHKKIGVCMWELH